MSEEQSVGPYRHAATWTDDCQGKKDFDAPLVKISTRYWPGPITVYDSSHPERGLHQLPGGRPSAHSSIRIVVADDETVVLAEQDFEGDTEAEVKEAVEAWADAQFARAVRALQSEFAGDLRRIAEQGP